VLKASAKGVSLRRRILEKEGRRSRVDQTTNTQKMTANARTNQLGPTPKRRKGPFFSPIWKTGALTIASSMKETEPENPFFKPLSISGRKLSTLTR